MKIVLSVDRGALRRWHLRLAGRLARREGVVVGFRLQDTAPAAPRAADLLFKIETLLFGLESGVTERIAPEALGGYADGGEAYLFIDLAAAPLTQAGRVWRVECDGSGLEPGLLAALLAGRAPKVRVLGPAGPIAVARPSADHIGLIKGAFDEMLERVSTLIEAALDGAAAAAPSIVPGETAAGAPEIGAAAWLARSAATVRRSAVRAAYERVFHAPHWRVGWRRTRDGFAEGGGWTDLADDGRRFYADPFPVVWRGRTFLFVEDYAHASAKGVISAVEFDAHGPLGRPENVLELSTHLSYPFVFERDGEMWMIPESNATHTVDLYRAREFPRGWVFERRLVGDVCASDATLWEQDGRWWMFATVRDGGGAHSDALWLWSAPDFRGPWTAHRRNPVLIDAAAARPAGRMFRRGGALYRPVQDCRAGYGAALGLARVDRLDDDGYAQTLETLVRPGGPDWPGRRLHSFNEAGGFEFIDGSAFAPRWPALRRPLKWAQRREVSPAPA